MKSSIAFCILAILAATTRQTFASEIFNLDFASPETGNYQTVFGLPTVQASVGPLEQALVFQAVTGYEQIRLDVGNIAPQYNIDYDVMVHNLSSSQYEFATFLDYDSGLGGYKSVYFHGGSESIGIFSPFGSGSGMIGGFTNDQVYHFGIALDFDSKTWSLEIDGRHRFSSGIDGLNLQSIRFSMAPWIGGAVNDPGNYAAIDNVVVTAVPEPPPFALITAGVFAAIVFLRHKTVGSTMRNQRAAAKSHPAGQSNGSEKV